MSWRESVVSILDAPRDEFNDDDGDDEAASVAVTCAVLSAVAEPPRKKQRGGSRPGKGPNIDRGRADANNLLYTDYFAPQPLFPEALFRRRFRMSRRLFARITEKVTSVDSYFSQRPDALGVMGFTPRQKVTAALRMLCYGICADAVDKYVRIAESTALDSLKRFVKAVLCCFGEEYLREPTAADIRKHTAINASRGFPGMFGSLDCTHWEWKNCPTAWHGMYQDRDGNVTMIMEAIATKDLWIWHSFVGLPGSTMTLMS